jgi:hypothetical protein
VVATAKHIVADIVAGGAVTIAGYAAVRAAPRMRLTLRPQVLTPSSSRPT